MELEFVDWCSIAAFFVVSLGIGLAVMKKSGASAAEFFLSGRNMPWWLLGVSMVATTFSTDTPNLVTDFVRQNGVSGNWLWWAFLLTGMLTVFVYAKLWRRSGVMTDVEFYELRYSGRPAAFLRGFRALYLGVFFNCIIMASVSLAAIKIGGVLLGLNKYETLLIACFITVLYSMLGGLRGVIITDFLQFTIAMIGAVWAAKIALGLPEIGGLDGLLAHEAVKGKLSILPDFTNADQLVPLLVLPLAIQWWSVWYPGSEPGGGGYIAQRMLSAKSENHAVGATLLFNAAHYALRPWPWIIVALCSLVMFPDLAALQTRFPDIPKDIVKHDLAYPAMLTYLPHGLLGVVVASLIAAFMSTISTHLNWGSSYVVNDFYKRFVNPEATEKQQVLVGRISTVLLMVLACAIALFLENAEQNFKIMLQVGAGTGLLFILRWFWWRINAAGEITAMIVSLLVAVYFLIHGKLGWSEISSSVQLVTGVGITTLAWIGATLITRPTDVRTLRAFYRLVKPGGPGWRRVVDDARAEGEQLDDGEKGWAVPLGVVCMALGCVAVYGALFATGYWIYGQTLTASILTAAAVASSVALWKAWGKLREF